MKIISLIICLISFPLKSDDSTTSIIWVTEVWNGFTERNGNGLYHEIVDAVFNKVNVEVTKQYVPFKRALYLVENKQADMTGGIELSESLLLSDTPILSTKLSILYRKGDISWANKNELKSYVGTWPEHYEEEFLTPKRSEYIKGYASSNRKTAVERIIDGKADYYIDAIGMMEQQVQGLQQPVIEKIVIQELEQINLKMAFSNSERGKRIKLLFEQGLQELHCSGKLRDIYKKNNRDYPIDKIY